jgi:hypothetical protein
MLQGQGLITWLRFKRPQNWEVSSCLILTSGYVVGLVSRRPIKWRRSSWRSSTPKAQLGIRWCHVVQELKDGYLAAKINVWKQMGSLFLVGIQCLPQLTTANKNPASAWGCIVKNWHQGSFQVLHTWHQFHFWIITIIIHHGFDYSSDSFWLSEYYHNSDTDIIR